MKRNSIFWIGYSDLMTSLFFIMLVLFVLIGGVINTKEKQIKVLKEVISDLQSKLDSCIKDQEDLERLLNLKEQFEPLINDGSFYYLDSCKKFILKDFMGIEIFEPNEIAIKKQYVNKAVEVGNKIDRFLDSLNRQNPEQSYLLVIEGNMANYYDQRINPDQTNGYLKSYQRALSVYKLWTRNGIDFRKYNVEVMLCGSGFNGLCRDPVEENNKRFSIQIIPKVSK